MLNNKRLLISEDEKKYILKLYNIILENYPPEVTKEINFQDGFDSGYYSKIKESSLKKLESLLTEMLEFLKEYPNNEIDIQIIASEDNNTNWDNEKNISLDRLGLAKLRAITMKNILINYFNKAIKDGELKIMPTFKEPIYLQGKANTFEGRKADRYVKFNLELKGNEPVVTTTTTINYNSCINNMVIELSYERGNQHNCNSAVYEIKINEITLKRNTGQTYASLNNGGILDDMGYEIKNTTIKDKKGNDKIVKSVLTSKDPGGSRNNQFIIDDTILSQLRTGNTRNLTLKITCRNIAEYKITDKNFTDESGKLWLPKPNGKFLQGAEMTWTGSEWVHNKWGNGCHDKVGDIKITNGNGYVQIFKGESPMKKDQEVTFVSFDPCTLK
jgi:hypothetical protein